MRKHEATRSPDPEGKCLRVIISPPAGDDKNKRPLTGTSIASSSLKGKRFTTRLRWSTMCSRSLKRGEEQDMATQTKKRRQQRAQSRLALARYKQQERARRQAAAAQRAENQWQKTLRKLAALGATLREDGTSTDGNDHPAYVVTFEGSTHRCRSRLQVQRWLKRTGHRLEEQQMSWAERHVQWMIENNCDDHGNPWE
jgi:hypothetical protein